MHRSHRQQGARSGRAAIVREGWRYPFQAGRRSGLVTDSGQRCGRFSRAAVASVAGCPRSRGVCSLVRFRQRRHGAIAQPQRAADYAAGRTAPWRRRLFVRRARRIRWPLWPADDYHHHLAPVRLEKQVGKGSRLPMPSMDIRFTVTRSRTERRWASSIG